MTSLAFLLLLQDPHPDPDPHKCATCRPALEKAVSYVKSNFRRGQLPGHVYAGLMFLILGDRGQDLQTCVSYAARSSRSTYNWDLALSLYFLSEVQLVLPTADVNNALVEGVNNAIRTIEPSGGWGHRQGYGEKTGYHKKGGSRDLGILTSMIFGALWNMRAAGMSVPESLLKRAEKNLESICDGHGFAYGNDNKVPDVAMSRAGYVYMGLTNAGQAEHPFLPKIVQGLEKRYKGLERGHSFAPLHHYGCAAAMHRAGLYARFAAEWIDKLIARQKSDGSVDLVHDGGTRGRKPWENASANTAAFAVILLLQKEGAMPVKKGNSASSASDRRSPFSQR
jgi:hypothetical protein